ERPMKKHLITASALAILLIMLCAPAVSAMDTVPDLPYRSYAYNNSDKPVAIPAPYTISKSLLGEDMGTSAFTDLSDIFYDGENNIYISDSGNNRIVITDTDFHIKKILSEFDNNGVTDTFHAPAGVYVNDKLIYVADTNQARIVIFDKQSFALKKIIEKPEIVLLGKEYTFHPTGLVVDKAGRIYVIALGINQGLICLDEDGNFSTFLGAPQVTPNMAERLWRKIATKKQLEQMQQYVPMEYSSALIDPYGFIYAASQSSLDTPVAKLNSEGKNVIVKPSRNFQYGDLAYDPQAVPSFTDIALDENESYYLLDSRYGKIYTYDQSGYLMYAFGGSGSQKGVFLSASAIEVIQGKLVVTDRIKGSLTVFERTEFGENVNLALKQSEDGDYENAEKTWKTVSKMASGYLLAQVGLSKIDIQHKDYRAAMEKLKPIHEKELYANVFERLRNDFIKRNFYKLIAAIAGIFVFLILIKRFLKRCSFYQRFRQSDTVQKLRYCRYFIFHPFDGFWDIKHEKRGNIRIAYIILISFVLCYGIRAQFSGYVVTGIISSEVNALYSIATFVLPLGFWVISNWCFTALMDGEGSMKDIFIATCYSLIPYVLFSIPMFLFSHILTASEAAFYNVADAVCLIWVFALLFFGMMITHNYSLSKSVLTAALTLVGICLMIFILLLITNIMQQVIIYFYNIYKELLFRTY
ncbi:MAG: YIP1 family protein, partial [Clostridia bacterium]|nr:YIP1 family protein [Clostridia bacterium]